jgi:hypothetical protein
MTALLSITFSEIRLRGKGRSVNQRIRIPHFFEGSGRSAGSRTARNAVEFDFGGLRRLRGKDHIWQIEALASFLSACASDGLEFDQSVSIWSEAALNQAGQ